MIKYLRKFFVKLRQIRKMENLIKVKKRVDMLNKGKSSNPWFAFDGFHALTKFKFGKGDESPTFYPSSGIILKVFINSETGELRVFPAKAFNK